MVGGSREERFKGREDFLRKDLRGMGTSLDGLKREAFNRLGWRKSVRNYSVRS